MLKPCFINSEIHKGSCYSYSQGYIHPERWISTPEHRIKLCQRRQEMKHRKAGGDQPDGLVTFQRCSEKRQESQGDLGST